MNKREGELARRALRDERVVFEELKENYRQALKTIDSTIKDLMVREESQSVIYQIKYQKALKAQVSKAIDELSKVNEAKVTEFLVRAYENGYVGTQYNLQGQGIPLLFPIDEKSMLAMIQTTNSDIKLSTRLWKDTPRLKDRIRGDISRGIASGSSYTEISRNLNLMTNSALYKTMRIALTEGHRVREASAYEASKRASEAGADVVMQWHSASDTRTRHNHALLNGQLREIDEPFEINGHEALYPGGFGIAAMDINCRCSLLQRARWALSKEELDRIGQSIEADSFEEFLREYKSGAVHGALNDKNDPTQERRESHAKRYYEALRNSKREPLIKAIANNTGYEKDDVSEALAHLLDGQYLLGGKVQRFDADYDISESIRRLREGKNIEAHDLVLIKHESLEYRLMNGMGMSYEDAHALAEKEYNYKAMLISYLTNKGN